MNDENESLKMRCTEVGKIAVEVSAEKALALLWDIKSIECYEPKVDSASVIPGTENKRTYFASGHFAGIPWSGAFTYELKHHGFSSEMKRGAFGVKVQGGFVVTSESLDKCLITHYERYEFPYWLSPLSLFVGLYLHRAMKKELGNLAQLIHHKDFIGNDDGIPVLNPDSVKEAEIKIGPGSLHTQVGGMIL